MKKVLLSTITVAALAVTPATAQSVTPDDDMDGNGTFSLEELQAVFPELTAEGFAEIDTNADGEADVSELEAAQDAGLLPAG